MKQTIKNIWKSLSRVNGNSLAEFATVSALMATLAATAAPKLSEMSEGTKGEKSGKEIDKILTQAGNFYQATCDTEGRGRFPGQEKYTMPVGLYADENKMVDEDDHGSNSISDLDDVYTALETFNSYDDAEAANWSSVFGTTNVDATAKYPSGAVVMDDAYTACENCEATGTTGSEEWSVLFNGNTLDSKFQDGHFIYVVIPGGGSGSSSFPPVIVVADLENPHDFNNSLEP